MIKNRVFTGAFDYKSSGRLMVLFNLHLTSPRLETTWLVVENAGATLLFSSSYPCHYLAPPSVLFASSTAAYSNGTLSSSFDIIGLAIYESLQCPAHQAVLHREGYRVWGTYTLLWPRNSCDWPSNSFDRLSNRPSNSSAYKGRRIDGLRRLEKHSFIRRDGQDQGQDLAHLDGDLIRLHRLVRIVHG